jgi:small redox-active disulfide protein 2
MKIQILGTGCPKCKKLTQHAEEAVKALGLDAEIEKVTQINDIIKFGVLMTPAVAIDGAVKSVGKLLSVEEIKGLLK